MTIQFLKTNVIPHGMAPSDELRALGLVEVCGRTAYKSEDKITRDSARSFVLMLKKHHHLSVLEHSNIVLKFELDPGDEAWSVVPSLSDIRESFLRCLQERNAYHRIHLLPDGPSGAFAVAGNFRGWIETLEHLEEAGAGLCRLLTYHLNQSHPSLFASETEIPPGLPCAVSLMKEEEQLELLKKDPRCDLPVFVFHIVCDRGITHELVRHRVLSFTQESTRYVNYRNKGMTLILPEELEPFYDEEREELKQGEPLVESWMERGQALFQWYQEDIGRGLRPEIARDILPNLLKSEIFVSGRWSGWKHFVNLRDSKAAHPRIRLIARQVRAYFESLGMAFE